VGAKLGLSSSSSSSSLVICQTTGPKGRGEVHALFWLKNLKERENSEDPGVDGRIILK
jgi:hypothetical protein